VIVLFKVIVEKRKKKRISGK